MKRRQFTQSFVVLAGGAALPAIAAVPSALSFLCSDLVQTNLCRDFFEARLGKKFRLLDSGSRTLVLRSVENACGNVSREQFHVVFEASPGSNLPEGIYQLERPRAGRFDLHLSESDQGRNLQNLVAIFNLQAPA